MRSWQVVPQVLASHSGAVPIKPGQLTLPSLAIVDRKSGKSVARTNPFKVTVESAIRKDDPQPQTPAGLRPPADLVFPWWVLVLLGALALAVVAGIIYGLYRWSRKNRVPAETKELPKPLLPEDEEALNALTDLEKGGALTRGDFKNHYFRVSEVLKRYIGRRYDFDAPESTTAELLMQLDQIWGRSNPDWRAQVRELFLRMDVVKFTDYLPTPDDASKIIPEARKFILSSRRRPVDPALTPAGLSQGSGQNLRGGS